MTEGGTTETPLDKYALVTAAYNEEAYIENLLKSVVSQSILPIKWIIVSDGSTDRTDTIVQQYAKGYNFIELHRIDKDHPRNFAAQVHAINAGLTYIKDVACDYVGNLDADVSFGPDYFSRLLERFNGDQGLGLSGGYIYEHDGSTYCVRKGNTTRSVPHAVQLFRRPCLEALGWKYIPFQYGGPDWYAEVSSRMNGWRVQSLPDLKVFHHRSTGATAGFLRTSYREGLMDYGMGTHPLFEILRVGRRYMNAPLSFVALARLLSFTLAYLQGKPRLVSDEFIAFLRKEEMHRIRSLLRI